jgi:hypothetical protein
MYILGDLSATTGERRPLHHPYGYITDRRGVTGALSIGNVLKVASLLGRCSLIRAAMMCALSWTLMLNACSSNSDTSPNTTASSAGTSTSGGAPSGGPRTDGGSESDAGENLSPGSAGSVLACGVCVFDTDCLGPQVCARPDGDGPGLCVDETGITTCCTQDGALEICLDLRAEWSDSYKCPEAEPEVGGTCQFQEGCVFGTDTSPILCDCVDKSWSCTECPPAPPNHEDSCESCVGCELQTLSCGFAEHRCHCDGTAWFCEDPRDNAEWLSEIRTMVEAQRAEIGCTESAEENPFVTNHALAVAESFHSAGDPPGLPDDIEGGGSWFAMKLRYPADLDLGPALPTFLGPGAPCTGVSLGIAVVGMPGEERSVVLFMSECLDCGDLCAPDCG